MLYQLFFAEFVVFSTDIILNVLLYTELYLARALIQSFVVVLKLKIEFIILNSLRTYSKSKITQQGALEWHGHDAEAGPAFLTQCDHSGEAALKIETSTETA